MDRSFYSKITRIPYRKNTKYWVHFSFQDRPAVLCCSGTGISAATKSCMLGICMLGICMLGICMLGICMLGICMLGIYLLFNSNILQVPAMPYLCCRHGWREGERCGRTGPAGVRGAAARQTRRQRPPAQIPLHREYRTCSTVKSFIFVGHII